MNEKSPLFLHRLPARLDVNQVAEILGFQAYEIPILMNLALLKPLGRPAPNGHKYFSADEILELSHDRAWLNKATHALTKYWKGVKHRVKINAADI